MDAHSVSTLRAEQLVFCPLVCPLMPTVNEKWVGMCPPVPHGVGAYAPTVKILLGQYRLDPNAEV